MVLDAHLSLCPEGMKEEVALEWGGSSTGKDSGSVTCKTTPLGLAVLLDDVKLVEKLLAKGASPNDCSDSGKALDCVGRVDMVSLLLFVLCFLRQFLY